MPEVIALFLLVVPIWIGFRARDFKTLVIHSSLVSLIMGTTVLMHPILILALPFDGQFALQFIGVVLLLAILSLPGYGMRLLIQRARS